MEFIICLACSVFLSDGDCDDVNDVPNQKARGDDGVPHDDGSDGSGDVHVHGGANFRGRGLRWWSAGVGAFAAPTSLATSAVHTHAPN